MKISQGIILIFSLGILFFKATSAKIYGWDTPANGNVAAPKLLPENTHSETDILKAITDGDNTDGVELTYRIISQDGSTVDEDFDFILKSNMIQTKAHRSFDYEKQTEYVLLIRAYENGRSDGSSATVTVYVEDLNDNPPMFPKRPSYVSYIYENEKEGTLVTKVTATDEDGSRRNNQIVRYDIVAGDDHDQFTIDHTSGRITTSGQPWNKALKDSYCLQIQAIDNGHPRLTGTTTVVVLILAPPGVNGADHFTGQLSAFLLSVFFCVYCTLLAST